MRKKANDKDVPADELLLAEAIAAAKARGLKWARAFPFLSLDGSRATPQSAEKVCALGALHLAGVIDMTNEGACHWPHLRGVIHGNDKEGPGWEDAWHTDNGESLGWAFRCAMTQDDE